MLLDWIIGQPSQALAALLLALLLDALLGDPERLYCRVPHPVVLAGRLVSAGERWNDPALPRRARFRRGLALTLLVTLVAALAGWAIAALLRPFSWGWIIEAVLASSLFAGRGLYEHVRAVAEGLARGLADGRDAVARIVGRDPATLDAAGVSRAAALQKMKRCAVWRPGPINSAAKLH